MVLHKGTLSSPSCQAAGAERLPTRSGPGGSARGSSPKLPRFPEIVVAVAPELDASQLEARFPSGWQVRFLKDDTYNALAAADLAIVSSAPPLWKQRYSISL